LCDNHPGIIAEKWEKLAVLGNAIFSQFPNKKPENATLEKNIFCQSAVPPFSVASGLWPLMSPAVKLPVLALS
jgi:hypothetical protein